MRARTRCVQLSLKQSHLDIDCHSQSLNDHNKQPSGGPPASNDEVCLSYLIVIDTWINRLKFISSSVLCRHQSRLVSMYLE